jgi:hypothetical protein
VIVSNVVKRMHQFTVIEDGNVAVMFRVLGDDAVPITQATVASITFAVYDLDATTPTSAVTTGTLTVADVVFDEYQTDDRWTVDGIGYNLRHDISAAVFTTGGHTYALEYKITADGGEVFHILARVQASPIMTS